MLVRPIDTELKLEVYDGNLPLQKLEWQDQERGLVTWKVMCRLSRGMKRAGMHRNA
jgi:hypothetical protein